jgi:transposase InsO family protein
LSFPRAVTDPYFAWALETRYRYLLPGGAEERIPIIIELNGITAQALALGRWRAPDRWQTWLRIPPLYLQPPGGLERATYCTATVTSRFFEELGHHPILKKVVQRVGLGTHVSLAAGGQLQQPAQQLSGAPKPGVAVVGIIDDGLAFAHQRFRRTGASRVEYLWRQDWPAGLPWLPVYGAELQKHNAGGIDARIAQCSHAGLVDEDEIYRLTGHVDFTSNLHHSVALRRAHGTHVMDLASGFDEGSAPTDRPIVAVQLPIQTTADTSGGKLDNPVHDALWYLAYRADFVAAHISSGRLPLVVNLSYGLIAGPHDGSSIIERAIDQFVALRSTAHAPVRVVVPAGNNRLSRCHASFRLTTPGARQSLSWRILPDDRTPSFLEIWLPNGGAPSVRVQVTPPGGAAPSPWISAGGIWSLQSAGGNLLCQVIYFNTVQPNIDRPKILIAVAETADPDAKRDFAPCGEWTVSVENAGTPAVIDAWIQRDDTAYGYPERGRQSRFDDPAYEHRDDAGRLVETDNTASYVRRAGTLNALATGDRSIVMGSFRRDTFKAAKYSAEGPAIAPSTRAGPEAMAPSEDSEICHGVLAAGARSGARVWMNGTSVAAPHVTRWIADRMAAAAPCDRAAVFALGVASDPPGAPPLPASRKGGGRINFPPVGGPRRTAN